LKIHLNVIPTNTYSLQYRDDRRAIAIRKYGQQWMLRAKEFFTGAILGARAIGSLVLFL
jgi:hypothetical protein